MATLNVLPPDIQPRASAHIPEQQKMVQTLIDKGHAYAANGSVYFDVSNNAAAVQRTAKNRAKLNRLQVVLVIVQAPFVR